MISYLLLSVLGTGLFYACYQLLLKNENWFRFNRFYLVVSLCLALLLPAINFDFGLELKQEHNLITQTEQLLESNATTSSIGRSSMIVKPQSNLLQNLILATYFLGAVLLLGRLMLQLTSLFRSARQASQEMAGFTLITLKEQKGAFSFFHYLFINPELLQNAVNLETILLHESVHRKQGHSFDNLFFELLKIVFWFNPLIWLFAKASKQNHEYLADEACSKQLNLKNYQNLILELAQAKPAKNLTSSFSFPKLKNRMIMMNKKVSLQNRFWKANLLALTTATFVTLSAFQYAPKEKPMVVVIDPGHGGKDHGVTYGELKEKDLVLQLSEAIKRRAKDYNIELIFSRSSDQFMELDERAKLQKTTQADFYLNLHINSIHSDNEQYKSKQGIEVFFSNQLTMEDTLPNYFVAEKFAQNFSNAMGEKLNFLPAPFFLLKTADCPAILLECGYLSNENDRNKLQDSDYHQRLADAILTSISKLKIISSE